MFARLLIAMAAVLVGNRGDAQSAAPPTFDERLIAVVARPASLDNKRAALARLGREARGSEEQATVEAFRTMVDGWTKTETKALAEAEAFAAANPRSGAAMIALAYALGGVHQPEQGADALIAGLAIAPRLVDTVSSSQVDYLLGTLRLRQDNARQRALARSLFDAGWTRGTADDRSFLALLLITDDLRQGKVADASKWLPTVNNPLRLYAMLSDRRFAPLWPEIERTAGKRLEIRWRDYLSQTRDAWTEVGTEDEARAYALALQRANLHRSLVDQFLTRFTRGYNCPNDPAARSVAEALVKSLIELGQLAKAESVIQRRAGARGAVDGNYLSYHFVVTDRHADAARLINRMLPAIAKSKKPIDDVQITLLRARLACANHKRGAATETVATDRLALAARLWVARCLDRPSEAKTLLLAGLEHEDDRLEALAWLQPTPDNPQESAFERSQRAVRDTLRGDPDVIAAVARYGVIQSWPATFGVPTDLAPAQPKRPPVCGDLQAKPIESLKVEDLVEKRPMP